MLLTRLLQRLIQVGRLTVIDASGRAHRFGEGAPSVTVRLHDRRLHRSLYFQPGLAAGEAYMNETLTIEDGSLYDFLDLIGRNYEIVGQGSLDGPFHSVKRLYHRLLQFNSPGRARRNVAHHYDLDAKLYHLFLDCDRQYSCAYFLNETDSLETAQRQKCRHIAAKLLLEPDMRVLDIGCGWGGMALYLAERFGAEVTGITLSEEQLRVARQRAAASAAADRADFALRDYRDETATYDRIVSVGMFEHVGANQYDAYFKIIRDRLADDGVALVHTIGHTDPPKPPIPWIRKYIFPGGYTPAFSEIVPAIEHSGLLVTDVEVLRLHYAETLRHWRRRFLANRARAMALYDERFCRMWEFYLASCEMAFRYMNLCVFQIQLARRQSSVPLTRDYVIEAERAMAAAEEWDGAADASAPPARRVASGGR